MSIVAKLSIRNQLTVPKEVVKVLHLRPGDLLKVTPYNGGFLAVPVEIEERYPEDLISEAAGALEKDLEQGKTFKSFKAMMTELRKHKKYK